MSRILIGVTLLCLCAAAFAQSTRPAEPGADLRVFLLTMGPGEIFYEKFGHNMIWIHDPDGGTDLAYNWGIFEFAEKNFIWNFIQGRMTYWMDGFDARTIATYQAADRSIWLQELNLTPAQKRTLQTKLEWNRRKENRRYRYDYYRDNCSSRLRDALDDALGGQIKAQLQGRSTGTTYRWHTMRLLQDNWPLYTALDDLMGHSVDRQIDQWEEGFLPVKFMEHLRDVKVRDQDGNLVPLVRSDLDRQLHASTRYFEPAAPPRHRLWAYLAISLVLGALMAWLGRKTVNKWTTLAFATIVVCWALVGGAAGAVSTWGWLFTDHSVARYNENWLQLSPIMLPLIVLVPAMLRGKRWAKKWGVQAAMLVAAMSLVGWAMQVLPSMNQVNGQIIALALPANVGMAWGIWMASKCRNTSST